MGISREEFPDGAGGEDLTASALALTRTPMWTAILPTSPPRGIPRFSNPVESAGMASRGLGDIRGWPRSESLARC
jgi:hypothetical protein